MRTSQIRRRGQIDRKLKQLEKLLTLRPKFLGAPEEPAGEGSTADTGTTRYIKKRGNEATIF